MKAPLVICQLPLAAQLHAARLGAFAAFARPRQDQFALELRCRLGYSTLNWACGSPVGKSHDPRYCKRFSEANSRKISFYKVF
jgi:hypothetical protein